MKSQWPIWLFLIGLVGIVLFAFNYQGGQEAVSLHKMFPDEEFEPVGEVEYEYVDESAGLSAPAESATSKTLTPIRIEEEPATASQPSADKSLASDQKTAKAMTSATIAKEELDVADVPFTIQVSSFRTRQQAERALRNIKAAGYPAYIVSKTLTGKGVWHRIYIGKFQTKQEASQYIVKVKKDYAESFIIAPR